MEPLAVPGAKVEGNGLRKVVPETWGGDSPRWRGRGRRYRPDARRPTILHTQPPEVMDDTSRYALITARRETLRTNTARLCQERWATSRITPDYGPPPPAADQDRLPEDMSKAPDRSNSPESSAGQAPTLPKIKARRPTELGRPTVPTSARY